jgi:hypothetical protein
MDLAPHTLWPAQIKVAPWLILMANRVLLLSQLERLI